MCGIVGVACDAVTTDRGRLKLARDSMTHRGPDDCGAWWSEDGRVGLGHRRLAVIDLSPGGHQPMVDADERIVISFNGEIYNFRALRRSLEQSGRVFRTSSDTEVVLAAYREWGVDCLARLQGMFSLAIYDGRHDRVFLARDRAGEKPLFYSTKGRRLLFASELKAIMTFDGGFRRVDTTALDCYLGMGYVPGDKCILADVHKLPPAHALTFDVASGATRVWRYWTLPTTTSTAAASVDQLVGELETVLKGAVARQMVADVPVGVLLSGGLDSSLVTAMAAAAVPTLTTFTITFPGHPRFDEASYARQVARHFDTNHIELSASEISPALLPTLARQYDEPLIDTSMLPTYLVTQLIRQRCTVALGGDGGDELFAGYEHYGRLAVLAKSAARVPRFLRRTFSRTLLRALPVGTKGRNWVAAVGGDFDAGVPLVASYFDRATRLRLAPSLAGAETTCEQVWASRVMPAATLLDRATRTDFANYLPEDILVKVDRASMLNSLEVRAPFLDQSVVEFAFGRVPESLKIENGRQKVLLKALAARVLPAGIDSKRKQGFSVPVDDWLRSEPWEAAVRGTLLDDSSAFERTEVERLVAGQKRGRRNGERLFGLTMFELWRREYGVELEPA